MKETILINNDMFDKMIHRLSNEILESFDDYKNLALIGIKTRGEFLARRISEHINKINSIDLPLGVIDITFHRDDFSDKLIMPKLGPSSIPFDINEKEIILIDDVLYTGRTIRAAMEEIFSLGRPNKIQLGVLIDRGHRELPIKANYVGKNYPTSFNEHIHVYLNEVDNNENVELVEYDE